MSNNPEKFKTTPEKVHEKESLNEARNEHQKRLRDQLERASELQDKTDIEQSRQEALEKATSIEHEAKVVERQHSPAERRSGPPNEAEREASYAATMNEVRTQMSKPSRIFSKAIHNKVVEETSEVMGSTIARPNALLSGAVFAFVLTLAIYLIAKNTGYPLSGFESIGTFILGWILGLAYDFIKIMVTGRK